MDLPIPPPSSSYNTSISQINHSSSVYQSRPPILKYPSLDDILCNRAPHPYSYANFVGFLSQNHCLETVEFTNDVAKYKQHFASGRYSNTELSTMWHRIIDAYIRPDAPKELNLPCDIRKNLSAISNHMNNNSDDFSNTNTNSLRRSHFDNIAFEDPPSPENLESAVDIAKELMKENGYLPFIAKIKCKKNQKSFHVCPISNQDLFGSHSSSIYCNTSNASNSSHQPSSTWQHPSSWSSPYIPDPPLSKSSSSESLFPGDEHIHFNTCGGPMTPPDSPHDLMPSSSCTSNTSYPNYNPGRSQSFSSPQPSTNSSIPLTNSLSNSSNDDYLSSQRSPSQQHPYPPSSISNLYHSQLGPYRNHWRKMSKRLKWGRRNSEKDASKLPVAPTSVATTVDNSNPGRN